MNIYISNFFNFLIEINFRFNVKIYFYFLYMVIKKNNKISNLFFKNCNL